MRICCSNPMEDTLREYFLVKPGGQKKPAAKSFWMTDNGENWIEVGRSRFKDKHDKDEVLEVVAEEHFTLLDWRKTPYYNPEASSGWLSREGRFYGCPTFCHDVLAWCVLGVKVVELERLGWVRIYSETWYVCQMRLSAEQGNWLSLNGHKVTD